MIHIDSVNLFEQKINFISKVSNLSELKKVSENFPLFAVFFFSEIFQAFALLYASEIAKGHDPINVGEVTNHLKFKKNASFCTLCCKLIKMSFKVCTWMTRTRLNRKWLFLCILYSSCSAAHNFFKSWLLSWLCLGFCTCLALLGFLTCSALLVLFTCLARHCREDCKAKQGMWYKFNFCSAPALGGCYNERCKQYLQTRLLSNNTLSRYQECSLNFFATVGNKFCHLGVTEKKWNFEIRWGVLLACRLVEWRVAQTSTRVSRQMNRRVG